MRFVSALLLLLWILCDVSIFGSCQVPHEPGIRRVTATVISSLDHRIPTSVRAQNQHPPLSSCPIDQDDCWCSCGHILPGAVFFFIPGGHEAPTIFLAGCKTPKWRSDEHYRPPRT